MSKELKRKQTNVRNVNKEFVYFVETRRKLAERARERESFIGSDFCFCFFAL